MKETKEADIKFLRMTQEPVEKLVCSLAVPSIATMLISALYNMADTYFVGSLGTSATGAVGIVFSVMAIIQAIGFFFGHGAGNYISRELGAQNYENAGKMAATGLFTSLLLCGVISVAGIALLEPIVYMLGATPTIAPHAKDYLFFILLGGPFVAASFMLNNLLRFQGSAVYGMAGMMTGAVLNVGLDPLFIFVFDMGVAGAALATAISQAASFCLLLYGCSRKGNVRIRLKNFAPSLKYYREMLRGGAPSLFRQGIAAVASICVNTVARGYGDAAIAAIAIVMRVTMVANSALIGFGQGFQPVCGFNYGARRFSRVSRAFWFCVKVATAAMTVAAVFMFVFAPEIVAIFRKGDPEVLEIGAYYLRLNCALFPLWGFMLMSNMMLQTIGDSMRASILAVARQGIFMIPLLYILTPLLGIRGIQFSQPVSDFATLLLTIPLTLGVLKRMANTPDEASAAPPEPVFTEQFE